MTLFYAFKMFAIGQSISREMANNNSVFEETDSESVMRVALLPFQGKCLSNKQLPDSVVNMMATNNALQTALF